MDANVYPASALLAAPVWIIRASVPHRHSGLNGRGVRQVLQKQVQPFFPCLSLSASKREVYLKQAAIAMPADSFEAAAVLQ